MIDQLRQDVVAVCWDVIDQLTAAVALLEQHPSDTDRLMKFETPLRRLAWEFAAPRLERLAATATAIADLIRQTPVSSTRTTRGLNALNERIARFRELLLGYEATGEEPTLGMSRLIHHVREFTAPDPLHRSLLRRSLDQLRPRADRLAQRFFHRLLTRFPHLQAHFSATDWSDQRRRFVQSLCLMVRLHDDPLSLEKYLAALGARHAALGVSDDDCPPFVETLLDAIAETLGPDVWTRPVETAWRDLLAQVAATMRRAAANRQPMSHVGKSSLAIETEERGWNADFRASKFRRDPKGSAPLARRG